MKIKYFLLFVFAISSALMAANVNWSGSITFTPANPAVGDNVTIEARFAVMNGTVNNINVIGKIDGKTVYSNLFPSTTGPQTITIPVTWTAAHSTKMSRLKGKPSKVKVEFSFSTPDTIETKGYSTETLITVKDAIISPITGIGQNVSQAQPDFELAPCAANANGTTDLVPVEFSFKYLQYGKFQYTIGIKNTGPRCVKKFHYKITYLYNGVDTVYREAAFPVKPNGWALEAGETHTIKATFDRHDLPYGIFHTSIDSEVQEISFTLNGLKLVVDFTMEVNETNETNNVYEKSLHWVED
jgi:hypothetical protein